MLYDLIAKRRFPKQFSLGARAVGWYEEQVEEWIKDRSGVGGSSSGRQDILNSEILAAAIGGIPGDVLRYRLLGRTQGFGTFQFSDETVDALQTALSQSKRGQRVNSIFGEGASPGMRKVREGLDLLKLPSDLLLRHGATRLVYGVALIRNLKRYLLGQDAKPEYLFPVENVEEATRRVSEWWVKRWLAKRIQHPDVLDDIARHRLTYPIRHGARVEIQEEGLLPFNSAGFLSD